jgi:hypothetical protein
MQCILQQVRRAGSRVVDMACPLVLAELLLACCNAAGAVRCMCNSSGPLQESLTQRWPPVKLTPSLGVVLEQVCCSSKQKLFVE